jgi:integrase/recombinase XerD
MKSIKPTDFAYHLSRYFKNYMPATLGLREKSIASYQTAFFVFLRFMKEEKTVTPDKMVLENFSVELLMEFLDYLECIGNSVSTRNHRLTVLRSFFKYIQLVEPKQILLMQQLLSLKHKKCPKPVVNYLTTDGVKLIMNEPSATTRSGYRDMLLLTVLYETGTRVSELVGIRVGEIRIETPATVTVHGKNGKSRIVPISKNVASLIRNFLEKERMTGFEWSSNLLFTNRSGNMLTGAGVTHILQKYADRVREQNPALIPEKLSPHCIRHSKAMHLLESGVDLIYIRDILGHEHLKTTEIYAKTDTRQKRMAIENAYIDLPNDSAFSGDWSEDVSLMQWVKNICG